MKDLSSAILNIHNIGTKEVHPGSVLVAQPLLNDVCFKHAVVTLVDCDDDYMLGLVMNLATGHTLDEYVDGMAAACDVPVYCGGPVGKDRMVVMHTLGADCFPGSREFAPGLYLGGDFDEALDYVNNGYPIEGMMRFFVGYSGWDANQLADEMAEGTWGVADSIFDKSELLTGDGDAYWHKAVRELGSTYRAWNLFPRNLMAN